jgi:flavin reductase (DIM6/NTAB) family NADH-FMN oxidoreductase RutF
MSETSFVPGHDSQRDFRDALGCFGTGVAVVTTMTQRGALAMTANSFAAVSLHPPLVLWCPARASRRHDAFAAPRAFAIHVLGEDQEPLARRFALGGDDFSDLDWTHSGGGPPLLANCLARFECDHHAVHDGGDHSIVLGRVGRVTHRPGRGLMFKRGRYGGFTDMA